MFSSSFRNTWPTFPTKNSCSSFTTDCAKMCIAEKAKSTAAVTKRTGDPNKVPSSPMGICPNSPIVTEENVVDTKKRVKFTELPFDCLVRVMNMLASIEGSNCEKWLEEKEQEGIVVDSENEGDVVQEGDGDNGVDNGGDNIVPNIRESNNVDSVKDEKDKEEEEDGQGKFEILTGLLRNVEGLANVVPLACTCRLFHRMFIKAAKPVRKMIIDGKDTCVADLRCDTLLFLARRFPKVKVLKIVDLASKTLNYKFRSKEDKRTVIQYKKSLDIIHFTRAPFCAMSEIVRVLTPHPNLEYAEFELFCPKDQVLTMAAETAAELEMLDSDFDDLEDNKDDVACASRVSSADGTRSASESEESGVETSEGGGNDVDFAIGAYT